MRASARQHPWLLLGWASSLLLSCTSTLALPYVIARVLDVWSLDARALLILCGLAALLATSTALRFYCVTLLGEHIAADLKRSLLAYLLRMDGDFHDRVGAAMQTARMTTDVGMVRFAVGGAASVATRCLLTGTGAAALLIASQPRFALWVLAAVPCVLWLIAIGARTTRKRALQLQQRIAETAALAAERLAAHRVVQAFCREQDEAARFRRDLDRSAAAGHRFALISALVQCATLLLIGTGVALSLLQGAALLAAGQISHGGLLQFGLYAGLLMLSVVEASHAQTVLVAARAALLRIDDLLGTPLREEPRASGRTIGSHEVVFDRVHFRYPSQRERPALVDASFHAPAGRVTAIVGMSGSGKSTVLSLLQRFHAPAAGSIRIGQHRLAQEPVASTRSLLSVVPQFPVIFRMSVRDNIAYGAADATAQAIIEAAVRAGADGFIRGLPFGYDTLLGPAGHALSGGQAQRIAIARALLSSHPVLLLDEPTSALDAQAELELMSALRSGGGRRTLLVVSHRPSVMAACDHVVLFAQGKAIAEGPHETLLQLPAYRQLLHADR